MSFKSYENALALMERHRVKPEDDSDPSSSDD
jgi:hypothetical protein